MTSSVACAVCSTRSRLFASVASNPVDRLEVLEQVPPATMVRVTSWTPQWADFPSLLLDFWTERHLCTLASVRADGRPHLVPVGVALDLEEQCAWVITNENSRKVQYVAADGRVAACQVSGRHWSTIEGTARVVTDEVSVARAVTCYSERYREPRPNPSRVALRIDVDRFLMSSGFMPA
jgi:F420H(2)-dependent biliverdin reductase